MSREAEEPGEPPPKIKAKDNPWYLLATLYGEPTAGDVELQARNRTAWNRYMGQFPDKAGREIANTRPHTAEAATPFTDEELPDLQEAFAIRHRQAASTADVAFPDLEPAYIDFVNVEFDRYLWLGDFVFPARINFSGAKFSTEARFAGATFFRDAYFSGATFSRGVFFADATFSEPAGFADAIFSGLAHFTGTTFSGGATFVDATFSRGGTFKDATFSRRADFSGATFSRAADFRGVTFSEEADFKNAKFFQKALFKNATFSREADFKNATFSGETDFAGADFRLTTFFVNVEMKGPTSFEVAGFRSEPPRFFGAKLHEGTVWRSISWPLPQEPGEAGRFIDAYERLKFEMDRLKKHEDELNFFALELQSKRVHHGDWKPVSELKVFGHTIPVSLLKIPEIALGSKARTLFGRTFELLPINFPARMITLHRPAPGLPIALYGLLCDYGRSYVRPLLGLTITAIAGAPLFWAFLGWSRLGQALGLSLANTFGVLGFRKDLIDPDLIKRLPGSLAIVGAVQTIFGIVLLFLFGLAIRNRFRIK